MSCTPRTARIVMWTAFPRALASREENGERNGEAGEDTRSELVVAGDRRGLLRRRLGEQHPVDDLVPQSVDGPRAVVLVGQSRTSGLYRVPCPGLAHAVSVPRPGSSRDRKSTRLNSSHGYISYAVFCLKKKKKHYREHTTSKAA